MEKMQEDKWDKLDDNFWSGYCESKFPVQLNLYHYLIISC